MSITIKFAMVRVRTGYRKGPRYRRVVDCTALSGARYCAAKMINGAILYRDQSPAKFCDEEGAVLFRRIARLGMRNDALWARVFAGQIDQHDPRIDQVMQARRELVNRFRAPADSKF